MTGRLIHDDAIMSPLQGGEKPSAVGAIIGHTYDIESSGTTHSEVAFTQNSVYSRR